MSAIEDLVRSLFSGGGAHIEVINLDDLSRDKEPWEQAGDRLMFLTDQAKRTAAIFRSIGRDDFADGFADWYKAHTRPIFELVNNKDPENDYPTEEDRKAFIEDFTARCEALLPVAATMIDAIKERHREAMQAVDCSDLFPIPDPVPDPTPAEATT